ncbi:hypothetical protein H8356DRAFT_1377925 [Neocallimastix lanati (nom. inval.)]|nr:hypothetical protein H8356DRAFT_1377925 [Neocallimastix sp. JGI-2020a]
MSAEFFNINCLRQQLVFNINLEIKINSDQQLSMNKKIFAQKAFLLSIPENFNQIIELSSENYQNWRTNLLYLLMINNLNIRNNLDDYLENRFDPNLVYDQDTSLLDIKNNVMGMEKHLIKYGISLKKYPLNLSISIRGGKETNKDSLKLKFEIFKFKEVFSVEVSVKVLGIGHHRGCVIHYQRVGLFGGIFDAPSTGSESKHICWDPKDGELRLNRVKSEETLIETRSGSDVQIDRQIWQKLYQFYEVKRMIRRLGTETVSTYSQTLNIAGIHAHLDITKDVGSSRQQDGGHGSRNPLRSVPENGWRSSVEALTSRRAWSETASSADLGGSSKYSNANFED